MVDLAPHAERLASWRERSVERFDRRLGSTGLSWSGQVSAVYKSAAIADVLPNGASGGSADRGRGGPTMVSLLYPSRELVPFGVVIPWEHVPIAQSTRIRLSHNVLFLASPDGERTRLHLTGPGVSLNVADRCTGSPTSRSALALQLSSLSLPTRTHQLVTLDELPVANLQSRLVALAASRLAELSGLLCGGASSCALEKCALPLLGLGPGSTPTGDDLLVGAAAGAFRFASLGWFPSAQLARFQRALERLPWTSTTKLGREMVAQASCGAFLEPLLNFVSLLGEQHLRPHWLDQASKRLAAMGNHSGADLMAGVWALTKRVSDTP